MQQATAWLARHWAASALIMGLVLLALAPLLALSWSLPVLLVYLHSPGYMLHQAEEHLGDRFQHFINERLFQGRMALTTGDILWINLAGVWGANLAALYAAVLIRPGLGLAAPYLMLVNAISHLASAVRMGANPGLWTSLAIFLPLGLSSLFLVPAGLGDHLLGLGISLASHAAIILNVKRRLAVLASASCPPI